MPSGTVQGIQVQELYSEMVILQWQPPELEQQNGVIIHYHMDILLLNLNSSSNMTFSNATGEVNDLSPYTSYQIRIAAATVIGVGPLSDPLNIRTEEDGKTIILLLLNVSKVNVLQLQALHHSILKLCP